MDSQSKNTSSLLWDLFCTTSLIGIWPRFIEPRLIFTSHQHLTIQDLPKDLHGLKILQISDLHLHSKTSPAFLQKLTKKCQQLQPDLIAFTGDFLCYSQLNEPERLKSFLQSFKAPFGCYAVCGNHDYDSFVSINTKGDYDVITPASSSLTRAFSRLSSSISLTKTVTEQAKQTNLHAQLVSLLEETPFKLLHNTCLPIAIRNTKLNICGLGEYSLGKVNPKEAFRCYDPQFPGIILLHNPDGISLLKDYPGEIVLAGHTHGGQVNLPWMWKKFTALENISFKKGMIRYENKWMYVNRGLGSVLPFRWFSPPEILCLTLAAS